MSDPEDRRKFSDPMGDKAAEAALIYLRDNAEKAGVAKAQATYMEHHVKTVLARCMHNSMAKSVAAQEVEARIHPDYLAALEAQREAIGKHEAFYWKRIAAQATLDAWRTKNANSRSMGSMA